MAKINIKKVLEAYQDVRLAKGFSDIVHTASVRDYEPSHFDYPATGNFKSLDDIRKRLRAVIEKNYPKKAFPYREVSTKIRLYRRNEEDHQYLWQIGEIDA